MASTQLIESQLLSESEWEVEVEAGVAPACLYHWASFKEQMIIDDERVAWREKKDELEVSQSSAIV